MDQTNSMHILDLENFKGPINVLLELIEQKKLSINDVALAQVTDEYIEWITAQQELPHATVAAFLVIAATLVLIKSRSLLPALDLTTEEEDDIDDLKRKLKLLQTVKNLSENVSALFGDRHLFAPRKSMVQIVFSPSKQCEIDVLHQTARELVLHLPENQNIPKQVVRKVVHISDMMERIKGALGRHMTSTSFRSIVDDQHAKTGATKRETTLVGFLAVLELVHKGFADVMQKERFDDIALLPSARTPIEV